MRDAVAELTAGDKLELSQDPRTLQDALASQEGIRYDIDGGNGQLLNLDVPSRPAIIPLAGNRGR